MRRKFPQLCAFVDDMQLSFYGGGVKLEDAYLGPSLASERQGEKPSARNGALPWSPPDRISVCAHIGALCSTAAESIPFVSDLRQTNRIKNERDLEKEEKDQGAALVRKREHFISSASIILSISSIVGFTLWYSLFGRRVLVPRVFIPYGGSRSRVATDELTQPGMALNVLDDLDLAFVR
jgi:hypothetical protein